jgi:hypothetical protein
VHADEGFKRFDVTPQQMAVIQGRLIEVLYRQGLWDQGVRFGMNFNTERTRFWVLIHPGRSGLTPQRCSTASLAARDEARPLSTLGITHG